MASNHQSNYESLPNRGLGNPNFRIIHIFKIIILYGLTIRTSCPLTQGLPLWIGCSNNSMECCFSLRGKSVF